MYLREGDAKGNSGDNPHIALYEGRHQLVTALQTHNGSTRSSTIFYTIANFFFPRVASLFF